MPAHPIRPLPVTLRARLVALTGRRGTPKHRGTLPPALPPALFPVLLERRPRAEKVLVRLPVEQIAQWSCR